jgi:hypothetical protein
MRRPGKFDRPIWRWLVTSALVPACSDGPPAVPVETATIAIEIGIAEGSSPYVFREISGIVADDAGRIIVSDLQADEVRVFDSSGSALAVVARSPANYADPAASRSTRMAICGCGMAEMRDTFGIFSPRMAQRPQILCA